MAASSCAGRTTSTHGSRPNRRFSSAAPHGVPGTATLGPPMAYGTGTVPNTTEISVAGPATVPSSPGTATKKSRQVTVRVLAS